MLGLKLDHVSKTGPWNQLGAHEYSPDTIKLKTHEINQLYLHNKAYVSICHQVLVLYTNDIWDDLAVALVAAMILIVSMVFNVL